MFEYDYENHIHTKIILRASGIYLFSFSRFLIHCTHSREKNLSITIRLWLRDNISLWCCKSSKYIFCLSDSKKCHTTEPLQYCVWAENAPDHMFDTTGPAW